MNLKGSNGIMFFTTDELSITEITHNNLMTILSTLGGTYTAIYSIIGIVITYFIYNDWRNSLVTSIMHTPEFQLLSQDISHDEIEEIIKERVSYKALFTLHQ